MSPRLGTDKGWFVAPDGRRVLLRGVNVAGSCKLPMQPPELARTTGDVPIEGWAEVSFVGRPFPLDEADRHLERIAHWGFDVLRLLTTWEAVEHAGPGRYDEAYLDYFREIARRAGDHGLYVFVDPHHDVWSRWTGGDGAPFWAFEGTGLLPERFAGSDAVELNSRHWSSNHQRVPVATMWTLFWAGDRLCPELAGVQSRLQDAFIGAMAAVAERVADLDNVVGYDVFNEVGYGYLGRRDLDQRVDFVPGKDMAFSSLEFLAAAEGRTVRNPDGAVLNAAGVAVWEDGCPWRRAGLWDLDADGRPVVGEGFERFASVNAWAEGMVPFVHRLRERLRAVHPDCLLFLEGSPVVADTTWDDPDPLVVNARHWYDLNTIEARTVDVTAYRPLFASELLSGAAAIGEAFSRQLDMLRFMNRETMGDPPMLLGEFGMPYDFNDGEAFRSGDYSTHEVLLDAHYRAVEAQLLHSTHWNYNPFNRHADGDDWNAEDFSIFCLDDQRDPADIDSGGRGIGGFCRPYPVRTAGTPVRYAFDPGTGRFELEVDVDPALDKPTEVYLPRWHYPKGAAVAVSAGRVDIAPDEQRLRWFHDGVAGRASLVLERPHS